MIVIKMVQLYSEWSNRIYQFINHDSRLNVMLIVLRLNSSHKEKKKKDFFV